jgi:hypothetical protein
LGGKKRRASAYAGAGRPQMKKLTPEDFVVKGSGDVAWLSHEFKGYEICIEPCMNGYDVALYDQSRDLVGNKICTKIDPESMDRVTFYLFACRKALKIADKKLRELQEIIRIKRWKS